MSEYFNHASESIQTGYAVPAVLDGVPGPEAYIESLEQFVHTAPTEIPYLFEELLPQGVIALIHGDPRSGKTFIGGELFWAAGAGRAPFGLERFRPARAMRVLYIQEEDPRVLTQFRWRALTRAQATFPAECHMVVRQGVNLDNSEWIVRLTTDLRALQIELLILDAARRLSIYADEGPVKVARLMGVLRQIARATGVTIVIVHHDTKPPTQGEDQRRRSYRASGGDWFAGSECLLFVERLDAHTSMVLPMDYKFSADPKPFQVGLLVEGTGKASQVIGLQGQDVDADQAELAGARAKIIAWVKTHPWCLKGDIQRGTHLRKDTVKLEVDSLVREGIFDESAGSKSTSRRYAWMDT
jgi:hypothetical protein